MNNDELRAQYDAGLRRQVEWTRMAREELPDLVRYKSEDGHEGYISWTHLTPENADRVIEEQIAHYSPLVDEFEWKWYSYDTPVDLDARLIRHGLTPEEPEALLVMDLEDAPAYIHEADTSSVRLVTSVDEIDEIITMEEEIWHKDMNRLRRGLKHDLLHSPELISIYGVWQDGRVVSAAWQFFLPPTRWVSLFGGSTLEQYRKRGYYTALIVVRAREALERGYRFLTVDASPDSRPILEKHGFQFLGFSRPFTWEKIHSPQQGD